MGEAVVIDPAYDPQGIINILEEDEMTLTGVLATHYHPDHVGGDMMGFNISGITDLLNLASVPIHVQNEEAELVDKVTGVGFDNLRTHSSGDKISVGSIEIELIHTPGQTTGSQ